VVIISSERLQWNKYPNQELPDSFLLRRELDRYALEKLSDTESMEP
jgi:hypothetical protein